MRGFWTFLLVAIFVSGAFSAHAGVRFITDVPQNSVQGKVPSTYAKSQGKRDCQSAGYNETSCDEDEFLVKRCPYDGRYYKACCNKEYSHSKSYCTSRGKRPSRRSCEGLYACE